MTTCIPDAHVTPTAEGWYDVPYTCTDGTTHVTRYYASYATYEGHTVFLTTGDGPCTHDYGLLEMDHYGMPTGDVYCPLCFGMADTP